MNKEIRKELFNLWIGIFVVFVFLFMLLMITGNRVNQLEGKVEELEDKIEGMPDWKCFNKTITKGIRFDELNIITWGFEEYGLQEDYFYIDENGDVFGKVICDDEKISCLATRIDEVCKWWK